MYNTITSTVKTTTIGRTINVTALTSDTMYRLFELLTGDRYTSPRATEEEATAIEMNAYAANMGADEANQYVRKVIGEDAYKVLEAKAADEDMEPYRLATEDDSIRDRLVDAAIDEYSTEYQREVIEGAMDAIESQYN